SWLPKERIQSPRAAELAAAPRAVRVAGPLRGTPLKDIERDAILGALQVTNWIVGGPNGAAAILGLKRTTLQARMQKHGIVPLRSAVASGGLAATVRGAASPLV